MTRVIINGSKGRMGRALIEAIARSEGSLGLEVSGQVDMGDALAPLMRNADVVIDFSFHTVTAHVAGVCADHGKPLVIGTTGHVESEKSQIKACARHIPMVWASNFSMGVNTLFWLAQKAAEILGPDYDIEILEMHHRLKKDAPSGTAATLLEILAEARRVRQQDVARYGRQGIVGERTAKEIGVHSLRGGDVVGDHTVVFAAEGERLELTHKAANRETFAGGALRAAVWVTKQKPGIYTMRDVLALK